MGVTVKRVDNQLEGLLCVKLCDGRRENSLSKAASDIIANARVRVEDFQCLAKDRERILGPNVYCEC